LKAHCADGEANRISRQNANNARRRNQTITNIHSHQDHVFTKHADSRNNLNNFLSNNYDMFKTEKESDHFKKL